MVAGKQLFFDCFRIQVATPRPLNATEPEKEGWFMLQTI